MVHAVGTAAVRVSLFCVRCVCGYINSFRTVSAAASAARRSRLRPVHRRCAQSARRRWRWRCAGPPQKRQLAFLVCGYCANKTCSLMPKFQTVRIKNRWSFMHMICAAAPRPPRSPSCDRPRASQCRALRRPMSPRHVCPRASVADAFNFLLAVVVEQLGALLESDCWRRFTSTRNRHTCPRPRRRESRM